MNAAFLPLLLAALPFQEPAASGAPDPGRLVVLEKSADAALVLQLPGGRILATLPTGEGPHEIAAAPDGRHAVVSNYGRKTPGSTLTVLDLAGLKVAATLDLGEPVRPHGIVFEPDGRSLWVTAELKQELWHLSFPEGKVLARIATGEPTSHMVALGTKGHAFVAAIGSGKMVPVDCGKGEAGPGIATGKGAEGIGVAPGGGEVWVTNRVADTVTVLDAGTLQPIATIPCPGFPIRVAFTPGGERALVSCAQGAALAVIDAGTHKVLMRIPMQLEAVEGSEDRLFGDRFGKSPVPIGIVVPPSGKVAYVANSGADRIAVVDLEKGRVVKTIPAGKEPDGIAWIPTP